MSEIEREAKRDGMSKMLESMDLSNMSSATQIHRIAKLCWNVEIYLLLCICTYIYHVGMCVSHEFSTFSYAYMNITFVYMSMRHERDRKSDIYHISAASSSLYNKLYI